MKTGAIGVEPHIDARCNGIENLNRIALAAVNDHPRFDVKRGNAAARQIGRANIACLAAIISSYVESFWKKISCAKTYTMVSVGGGSSRMMARGISGMNFAG